MSIARHNGRISAPAGVLMQELPDDEVVFLNLATEEYFGLDRVGGAMYRAVVECGTVDGAHERLRTEFDVEPERLRRDIDELVETLLDRGLLEHHGA